MEEEIKKAYSELPKKIQDAIFASKWEDQLSFILKKYNLRIDQIAVIEETVVLVMLGLMPITEFIETLKTDAEIKDDETINNLLIDLEESIFKKIRIALIDSVEMSEKKDEPARADILKEIEDKDETAGHSTYASSALIIEPNSPLPSTQVNTAEQNQEIISKNSIAQKLQTPSVSAPKTVTVDPYREMPL